MSDLEKIEIINHNVLGYEVPRRYGELQLVKNPLNDPAEDHFELLMKDDDDTLPVVSLPSGETVDMETVKFVLDSVIDFLEVLKLSGEELRHAGQLLRDVEALRQSL